MMEFYGDILAEANDAPGDKDVFQFKSPAELRALGDGESDDDWDAGSGCASA